MKSSGSQKGQLDATQSKRQQSVTNWDETESRMAVSRAGNNKSAINDIGNEYVEVQKMQRLPKASQKLKNHMSEIRQKTYEDNKIRLQSRRQIQTILDNHHEGNANFHLVTSDSGRKTIQGCIDKSFLSKNEKTELMNTPAQSFYQHYERPVNRKVQEALAMDFRSGQENNLYNMTPEVKPMRIETQFN